MAKKFNGNIIAIYPNKIKTGDPVKFRISWSAERLDWQIGWHTWIEAHYNTRTASSGAPSHFGKTAFIDLTDRGYNIVDLGIMPDSIIEGTLELKAGLAFGLQSETLDIASFIIYPADYDGEDYNGDYVNVANPLAPASEDDQILQYFKYALYILLAGLALYMAVRLVR